MPKAITNTKSKKNTFEEMYCQSCNKSKNKREFYNTNQSTIEKYPICKKCIEEKIDLTDMNTVYNLLKDMDIGFFKDAWDLANEKNPIKPFGRYMRYVNSLPQYKGKKWQESRFEIEEDDYLFDIEADFKVTKEMILRWGKLEKQCYFDYFFLEDFYWGMKNDNKIESKQDEITLIQIAKVKLIWDKALAAGDTTRAKQASDSFRGLMADAAFRRADKLESEKNGGIRSWGVCYKEVEKDDFIFPWDKHYKKKLKIKDDIVDKTIFYVLNKYAQYRGIPRLSEIPDDTPRDDNDE